MRDITSELFNMLDGDSVCPVLFVELEFDSDTLNLWSGLGEIQWDSKTWTGAGDLGSVSGMGETESIEAKGMTLSLSGIPSESLALALNEEYQGRLAKVWFGLLDSDDNIIADPARTFSGRMDIMTSADEADSSTISVTVESRMIDLLNSSERRWTHEDQQIDYPGDMGFEFVTSIQNYDLNWEAS